MTPPGLQAGPTLSQVTQRWWEPLAEPQRDLQGTSASARSARLLCASTVRRQRRFRTLSTIGVHCVEPLTNSSGFCSHKCQPGSHSGSSLDWFHPLELSLFQLLVVSQTSRQQPVSKGDHPSILLLHHGPPNLILLLLLLKPQQETSHPPTKPSDSSSLLSTHHHAASSRTCCDEYPLALE